MSILRLEHVSTDYITEGIPVAALRDVSLEAGRGGFVVVAGRSGCGTTLGILRSIHP